GHFWRSTEGGSGGDIDNTAVTKVLQARHKEVAAVDHAPQVDVHTPAPVIQRHLADWSAEPDTGIVDHQCHRTAEQRFGIFRERSHLILVADITLPRDRMAADSAQT